MNLETDNKIQKKGITLVIPNPCGNIKETKMKNSGVEWIGEIPDDWESIRLKYIYSTTKAKLPKQFYDDKNLTPYLSMDFIRDSINTEPVYAKDGDYCSEEDILILWDGSNAGEIVFNHPAGYAPSTTAILKKLSTQSLPVYDKFYLKALEDDLRRNTNGMGIPHVNGSYLNNSLFLLPPKSTQQHIASYLDKKCSKIEETIQNQQLVIEKLKAYKQSLITEAVTGKKYYENCHTDSILLTQNPNEDMKTEIPLGISNPCGNIEFKYCNLGFIADFKNGLNYNASDFGTEVKFLGVGDFQNYLVLNDESMFSNIITDTEIEDDYYLKNGDIIFVRSNGSKELVGRAIMVDNIDFKVTYSGFCIRLRNKEPKKINSKFLLYFFRSDYFRNELQRLSQGSNISNINQDLLSHIKIPLVDIRFQESVVDFLDKKCTAIDAAIEQKQNLIEKLTEYKKSLIYECVTGKKEIS